MSEPTSVSSNQRLVEALQRAEDARILRQGNYDLTLAEQDRAVLVAELERLREENQSLRNLANNLRPGPISQALQDSPDYSGQTIERLRAALGRAHDELRIEEVDPDECRATVLGILEKELSGDSSASEARKPSRDAEHCDYPDCEQHNALVVERLRAALNEVSKTLAYQGFGKTHWNGCERSHWTCRLGKIVEDALSGDSQSCTCRKLPEPPSDDCPIHGESQVETTERQNYQESDGCPTELAVLQRFWREHHASGECAHDWKNVVNVETIKYGKRLKVCMKCGAERVGSVEETSCYPSDELSPTSGPDLSEKALVCPDWGDYHNFIDNVCSCGAEKALSKPTGLECGDCGSHSIIEVEIEQPEKVSNRPVCNKCQTPMRRAQTDYGMGWRLDCACKDGGPAKREPDKVDCGNPVMVNAEWYGPCTLQSGHEDDCERTTKETVPRSDESQRMPFQKTSPRTLNQPERNAINHAADASVEVVDPDEITHGKDCQCGLCKHAHDL